MEYFRAKEVLTAQKTVDKLLDNSIINKNKIIADIFEFKNKNKDKENQVSLGSSVIEDLGLLQTGSTFKSIDKTHTLGGSALLADILKNPSLNWRKHDLKKNEKHEHKLKEIANLENDVLWMLSINPSVLKKPPISALFPSTKVIEYINQFPNILAIYHIYRAYGAPILSVLSPLSAILGPYWFLRYKMGFAIGLIAYLALIWKVFLSTMTCNMSSVYGIIRYIVAAFYIFVFFYHIINTIEIANLVRRMRNEMSQKVANIKRFINLAKDIGIDSNIRCNTLTDLYNIFKNTEKLNAIKKMLLEVYEYDINMMCNTLLKDKWCIPHKTKQNMKVFGLRHPMLEIDNPVSLKTNLIVTGPNAAGKSSYVKAILCNILFAHTLGIVCAYKAYIPQYDAIHSYMRIWDSPGEESLFEAEVSRCRTIIDIAKQISQSNKKGVFFLDEPMHSTPPIEGAATAKSLIRYLGELPGIRIVVCTHFHSIPSLELESKSKIPSLFKNVSMSAEKYNDKYTFSFKLNKGPSFQCIALELLKDKSLPKELIDNAINYCNAVEIENII